MTHENLEISPDHLPTRLWQELTRATHDRHHDWRTPILATQGIDQSGPQARTVVLRHADASAWSLRIYTDARSPKCAELMAQPLAQLTFWSKRLNWQLRVSALATIDFDGEQVKAARAAYQAITCFCRLLKSRAPRSHSSFRRTTSGNCRGFAPWASFGNIELAAFWYLKVV